MKNIFKKSFKNKIIIPAAVIFVALVAVLTLYLFVRLKAINRAFVDDILEINIGKLEFYLEEHIGDTRTAAVSMAGNLEAVRAISERDADGLARAFASALELYRVTCFTVTDAGGTVLYGAKTGVVSGERNITNALGGRVSSYFESDDTVKIAARTGAPVYGADGALIGVVSAGVRLDSDDAASDIKRILDADVLIFYNGGLAASTVGARAGGTVISPPSAEASIINADEFYGEAEILGTKYTVFNMPLRNADGEAFASILTGTARAGLEREFFDFISGGVIIVFVGLLISTILLYVILSTISRPIVTLSNNMDFVAEGNLSITVDSENDDELGRLGKSLQKAVGILNHLLDEINTMINEHINGNSDYYINAEAFLGDYRKLVELILELAALGIKDQLTGTG